MRPFYTLGILLYTLGLRIAALCGHRKARLMVRGWAAAEARLRAALPPQADTPTAWFHVSSLGEFEQARPLLEAMRASQPSLRIVLSFFSPSGYEVRHSYSGADAVIYLPPDTPRNARRLVQAIAPTTAVFVKYDIWYNYLHALRRAGTRTILISAIFRPGQYFFRPWGRWFANQLRSCFAHIFVQNEQSLHLLRNIGIAHCSLAGDTRFDRVQAIAQAAEADASAEHFCASAEGPVIVAGSTWPPDEALLAALHTAARPATLGARLIIAPHEIDEAHLRQIEALFPNSCRYSRMANYAGQPVLIIDNIGLLSRLYRYGAVAYIGGGFGVGIHNILEAIAFGSPVLFGPNHTKFQEAHDALQRGCAICVHNAAELSTAMQHFDADPAALQRAAQACAALMAANTGSTQTILSTLAQ